MGRREVQVGAGQRTNAGSKARSRPLPAPASPYSGAANRTGLPDRLKAGMEALSGVSLDEVRVHYNSSRPAGLDALAFAQGAEIHLAPGQERQLPHEAWHLVQQAQGRVRPTMRLKNGIAVNGDDRLEQEADIMGARSLTALPSGGDVPRTGALPAGVLQRVWNKKGEVYLWDQLLDGVTWYGGEDGKMWFEITHPGQVRLGSLQDYRALEGHKNKKSWEEWKRLELAGKMMRKSGAMPRGGANLWMASNGQSELYLLGTHHSLRLHQMAQGTAIGQFLLTTKFTHIRSEVPGTEGEHLDYKPGLAESLGEALAAEREMAAVIQGNDAKAKAMALKKQGLLQSAFGAKHTLPLDEAYYALAASKRKDAHAPNLGYLESEQSKKAAHATASKAKGSAGAPARSPKEVEAANAAAKQDVAAGDQRSLFTDEARDLSQGLDTAATEERNAQWLEHHLIAKGATQLWIIGAAHLPGLIIALEESGWNPQHVDLDAQAQGSQSAATSAVIPPQSQQTPQKSATTASDDVD